MQARYPEKDDGASNHHSIPFFVEARVCRARMPSKNVRVSLYVDPSEDPTRDPLPKPLHHVARGATVRVFLAFPLDGRERRSEALVEERPEDARHGGVRSILQIAKPLR